MDGSQASSLGHGWAPVERDIGFPVARAVRVASLSVVVTAVIKLPLPFSSVVSSVLPSHVWPSPNPASLQLSLA